MHAGTANYYALIYLLQEICTSLLWSQSKFDYNHSHCYCWDRLIGNILFQNKSQDHKSRDLKYRSFEVYLCYIHKCALSWRMIRMTYIWMRGMSQNILFFGSYPSDFLCTNEYTYIQHTLCPDGVPFYTLKKVNTCGWTNIKL